MHVMLRTVILIVALGVPAHAQTAASLITRAVRAMGGAGALDSLVNKSIEINAANFALGQEETPLSPARATIVAGRGVFDYAGSRLMTSQEQRLVTGVVNRTRRVTTAAMSMSETNGVLAMDAATVPANIERGLSLEIERIMLAALHHPTAATLLAPKTLRGETADGIRMLLGPDMLNVLVRSPSRAFPLANGAGLLMKKLPGNRPHHQVGTTRLGPTQGQIQLSRTKSNVKGEWERLFLPKRFVQVRARFQF